MNAKCRTIHLNFERTGCRTENIVFQGDSLTLTEATEFDKKKLQFCISISNFTGTKRTVLRLFRFLSVRHTF